jgi:hypothetical protein
LEGVASGPTQIKQEARGASALGGPAHSQLPWPGIWPLSASPTGPGLGATGRTRPRELSAEAARALVNSSYSQPKGACPAAGRLGSPGAVGVSPGKAATGGPSLSKEEGNGRFVASKGWHGDGWGVMAWGHQRRACLTPRLACQDLNWALCVLINLEARVTGLAVSWGIPKCQEQEAAEGKENKTKTPSYSPLS